MALRLVQCIDACGAQIVIILDDTGPGHICKGYSTVRDMALAALDNGKSLSGLASTSRGKEVAASELGASLKILPPISHPDPAHVILAGTGLTHLGSAEGRDKMHKAAAGADLTDSMRMFNMGLKNGKPATGETGVQPEWFYKGDGSALVATGDQLTSPAFALDGGEEPEIAGIYIIAEDGTPHRIGYSLANEFSDHVTERGNYLWLAHSKLRPAALGPEIYLGELPASVEGTSRIERDGKTVWKKPFLSGEANMSHTFDNLEQHHFKYGLFRKPGDIHVHFFGTATLSCADGFETQAGDTFEISASPFRLSLRNALSIESPVNVKVKAL